MFFHVRRLLISNEIYENIIETIIHSMDPWVNLTRDVLERRNAYNSSNRSLTHDSRDLSLYYGNSRIESFAWCWWAALVQPIEQAY